MGGLDFFADLVVTGTVLGLDHTSERPDVEAVFGREFAADVPRDVISDFGLVEFGWARGGPRRTWEVAYFGAQAHRLPELTADHGIESVLVERYGAFPSRLDAGELLSAVRARGFALRERSSHDDGCVEYGEPTSRIGFLAVSDARAYDEPPGTVLKVLGPTVFSGRLQRFAGYARHILTLSDQDLRRWLDRREPEAEPGRGDWWAGLRAVVARQTGGRPEETVRWRRLGMALDRHAVERGVDTPDEGAVNLIIALGRVRADDLPSMDEAVERWLAAAPPLAEAARLCARRLVDPDDIRLARRLRSQIHAIEPCAPFLTSSDELRAWVELKPALLGRV
ncbi:hypothetical protein FDA94_26665 [Herbidospora galbida]|uniref:Uncharacterized protein n=1 Tax=Herbidospora galbida TaxID=2575442 RepID=A0A4U3M8F6_9ACTN|nr:hypothetical protein [Herbidospora galbida]TKK85255.1 hypothetical protein FDA94_26665 [Herbidospora galbida]